MSYNNCSFRSKQMEILSSTTPIDFGKEEEEAVFE
jgi:hypothetical protein